MTWNDLRFWTSTTWKTIQPQLNDVAILPARSLVFRPFIETPLDQVKVVILANEPYALKGTPDGLAYSTSDPMSKMDDLPQVLQNILVEAQNDVGIREPKNGSLRGWARQGVLLWNAVPTVRKRFPFSHLTMGWEELTREVLEAVYLANPNAVFVFWDDKTRHLSTSIPKESQRLLIKGPGVTAAYSGWFNSRPFSKINELLEETQQPTIDWNVK